MPKPKIGLMTLSLPRERTDIAEQAHKELLAALQKQSLEVVPHPKLVLSMEDAIRVSEDMAHQHLCTIVYNVATWIYAPMVVSAVQVTGLPSIVYGYRSPAAFGLVGAAITHGSLDEVGFTHRFAYGHPTDPVGRRLGVPARDLVLTFNNLIRRTPFVGLLGDMVAELEEAYGHPVDTEFREISSALMDEFRKGTMKAVVSEITMVELMNAPPEVRKILENIPKDNIEHVEITEEASILANRYISEGVLGKDKLADAQVA